MSHLGDDLPPFPPVLARVFSDGTGEVTIGNTRHRISADDVNGARAEAAALITQKAARVVGGPVRVEAIDPTGSSIVLVHPDGTVTAAPPREDAGSPESAPDQEIGEGPASAPVTPDPPADEEEPSWWRGDDLPTSAPAVAAETGSFASTTPASDPPAAPASPDPPTTPAPAAPAAADPAPDPPAFAAPAAPARAARAHAAPPSAVPTPAATTPVATNGPRHARKSFIAAAPAVTPAQVGFRGALNRVGIRAKPSRAEQLLRDDVIRVSQHWPGPRTIAIANGKGSANKTPTMVCLAAVFGRYGGTGVLGWDNNETRGTASWRTQQGPHQSTALDLLPHCNDLLGTGAQAAQLAAYVHHQVEDRCDVLWSDQSIEGEHEISGEEVDAVHQVASKYYRLILMDSGNNERASNWRAMIGHADQLVVPCTNVEDTAEAGARMLEALTQRDEHSAHLASNAVAIVSQRTPGKDPDMTRIEQGFKPLVRRVVTVPHDPALYSGVIRFDSLRPATQRAWLAAGAAVAEGL